jgi:hypothetical protein
MWLTVAALLSVDRDKNWSPNSGQQIKKKIVYSMNVLLIYFFACIKLEKRHKNYWALLSIAHQQMH